MQWVGVDFCICDLRCWRDCLLLRFCYGLELVFGDILGFRGWDRWVVGLHVCGWGECANLFDCFCLIGSLRVGLHRFIWLF